MNKRILALTLLIGMFFGSSKTVDAQDSYWDFQSIDTMKYSRDLARERMFDPNFSDLIRLQVWEIKKAGATHVAIATPYDKEFVPFLKKWVDAARANDLKVWFRGNLSGWEGWFGYERIGREEHIQLIKNFILSNPDIFQDGDIFTPCTECENGGPGDPRYTGGIQSYRQFLVSEYEASQAAFKNIGKKIASNYFSMNGDVARLVMDKKTTEALGGIVVVDHYVETPEKLAKEIKEIATNSGGKVVLGEFGAPIPDIDGSFTEREQALWLAEALRNLSSIPELIGLNYWVGFGGTTAIWEEGGKKRAAVSVLKEYFIPKVVRIKLVNDLGYSISGAEILVNGKVYTSDSLGEATLLIVPGVESIKISSEEHRDKEINLSEINTNGSIILKKRKEGIFFRVKRFINRIYQEVKDVLGLRGRTSSWAILQV